MNTLPAAMTLILAISARGSVIIDNLQDSTSGSTGGTGTYLDAARFTTGSSATTLGSITLLLVNNSASPISVDVDLDNSSFAQLTDFGTVTVAANESVGVDCTLSGGDYALSAATTYAIAIDPDATKCSWDYTTTATTTGSGSIGYGEDYTRNFHSLTGQYFQMDLDTVEPVPEPVNYALGLFGLVFVAGYMRNARRGRSSASKVA